MQQRSKNKKEFPKKWDVSTAGHVSAGQTSEEAAIREVYEEVGITIEKHQLQKILTLTQNEKISENCRMNHIGDFYIVKLPKVEMENIKMQESEVEQVKLCNLEEVKEVISNNEVVKRPHRYFTRSKNRSGK